MGPGGTWGSLTSAGNCQKKNGEKLTLVHCVCSTLCYMEFSPSRSAPLQYSAPVLSLRHVSLPKNCTFLYRSLTFSLLFATSLQRKSLLSSCNVKIYTLLSMSHVCRGKVCSNKAMRFLGWLSLTPVRCQWPLWHNKWTIFRNCFLHTHTHTHCAVKHNRRRMCVRALECHWQGSATLESG